MEKFLFGATDDTVVHVPPAVARWYLPKPDRSVLIPRSRWLKNFTVSSANELLLSFTLHGSELAETEPWGNTDGRTWPPLYAMKMLRERADLVIAFA